nr:hypothetical protein [Micrococcus terreus]
MGDVVAEIAPSTMLGRVDGDDVITHCLIQYPDEWRDGVLDRRGGVLGLPSIDSAVDHPGGDLRNPHMPERGEHAEAQPGLVQLGGGGPVQAPLPPVTDRGGVISESDGRVVARLGRCPHLIEELLHLLLRMNLHDPAYTPMGGGIGPADEGTGSIDAALDIGGELHPDRRHPPVPRISHDPDPVPAR